MTALVRCTHVGRTYGTGPGSVSAVRDVSCEVQPAATVAVVGPSGSGKSTLLHLMAGLERPTAGTVEWPALGADPLGRPGEIGMVFQGPSLLPALDVLENVALPLVLAGLEDGPSRDRALAALARLDLGAISSKLPEELSGGQAQRVSVARVLAGRPRLILADEPTGQLDAASGRHVLDVLLTVTAELGAALVVSTHDRQVSERLNEQWRMHDGTVQGIRVSEASA